ncbi:unnamed protein product, partial [Oppiella nova]
MCTDRQDVSGNAGLWDQVLAMEWVKKYIHIFGGNPNDLTVFGQSGGSESISAHILSNVSNGYFSKAILESASCLSNVQMRSRSYATRVAHRFASFMNCEPTHDYIQCLQNKSVVELIIGQSAGILWNVNTPDAAPRALTAFFPFYLCFGNEIIPKNPNQLLQTGNFRRDLRVLLGHQTIEGAFLGMVIDIVYALFGRYNPSVPFVYVERQQVFKNIQNILTNKTFNSIAAQEYTQTFAPVYNALDTSRLRRAGMHAIGDYGLTCGTYYLSYANSQSPCYGSVWCNGPTHWDEIPLVFGFPYFQS